jgi:hypothetical protein
MTQKSGPGKVKLSGSERERCRGGCVNRLIAVPPCFGARRGEHRYNKIRVIRSLPAAALAKAGVPSWFYVGEVDPLRRIFQAKSSYFFTRIHRTP